MVGVESSVPEEEDHLDDPLVAVPDRVALEVGSHVEVETTDEVLETILATERATESRKSHTQKFVFEGGKFVFEACTENYQCNP